MTKHEQTHLQNVGIAARKVLTEWQRDEWCRLNAEGPLRDAMAELNELASKPGVENV